MKYTDNPNKFYDDENNIKNKFDSIEKIIEEVNKIKFNCCILNDLSIKYTKELQNEFKNITNNIINSSNKINDINTLLQNNQLKNLIDVDINVNYRNDYKNTLNIQDYNIDKIEFDINDCNNNIILCQIAFYIFDNNVDIKKIKINKESLIKFINLVSTYYHDNYFHNFKHAIMVMQFVHLFINKIDIKNKINENIIFAILISALVHDVDHPGHTNSFEINSKSYYAQKYNNISVLENHHCSIAFYLIHSKEIKLFENLNKNDFIIITNIIRSCIIGTDMKLHTYLIEELENKFYSNFDFSNIQDIIFFCKVIIHVADLSNQLRPFNISFNASCNLLKEYLQQIEKEKQLKLPIQDYMKLDDDIKFYSSEHYFGLKIVMPLWNLIIGLYPELKEYYLILEKNISLWKEMIEKVYN